MGPYPAIVEEELWLKCNVMRIEKEAAEVVIESVLVRFQETFPGLPALGAEPYIRQARTKPRAALRCLLARLRDLATQMAGDVPSSQGRNG